MPDMGSRRMPDCASSWPACLPSRCPSSDVTVVVGGGLQVGKRWRRGALVRGKGEFGHELRLNLLEVGRYAGCRVRPARCRYHDAVKGIVITRRGQGQGITHSGAAASRAVRLGSPQRVSTVLRMEV